MTVGDDIFGLVGYQIDGKYLVESAVARGGFGVVYRARHAVLRTQHAVKVMQLPEDLSPKMRERFLHQFVEEARIIAQFQHPAVVRVTDFGVAVMPAGEQSPWMVLEWIEGRTLAQDLAARRGQSGRSPREVLEILRPVIDALAAAHEMGIVHRDIKPGNIMLAVDALSTTALRTTRRPMAPAARLLDFGIAKLMNEGDDGPATGHTRTASVATAYSPRYAAPEQVSGTRTGPWTDVHAIGLLVSEMLTDRAPFASADKLELQMQVMSPSRPTPAHLGLDVGPWEPVLARALAAQPRDRFANAGELLEALEANVPAEVRRLSEMAPQPPIESFFQTAPSLDAGEPITAAPHDSIPTLSPAERAAGRRPASAGRAALVVFSSVAVALLALGVSLARAPARRPATTQPRPPVAQQPPPVAQPTPAPVAQVLAPSPTVAPAPEVLPSAPEHTPHPSAHLPRAHPRGTARTGATQRRRPGGREQTGRVIPR